MFSSFFGVSDPNALNFRPVTSAFPPNELFGKLEPKDTEWACAKGFITETQTWYHVLEDGTFFMCQVIHSSIGLWSPTIQFTCKVFKPQNGEHEWRSINVSNFACPPPASNGVTYDKRSCKADEFTIIHQNSTDPAIAESYNIRANLGKDLQISFVVSRPSAIPGWKLGNGPQGGFSYFGADPAKPDGYVVHRFWPRTTCSGHIVLKGQALNATGSGMFVHAIQGMRPNLIASRWNFAHFSSEEQGGVSAIQMEFTTTPAHGKTGSGSGGVKVNVGSLVIGGKLVSVTGETIWPGEVPENADGMSRATHINLFHDKDTGYEAPSGITFQWAGPSIVPEAKGTAKADLQLDVGTYYAPKGLVQKVDVLAEIPYVIKMAVNYVAGTKPYIYQYFNPATLNVTVPKAVLEAGAAEGETALSVSGYVFNEASFVS